MNLGQRDLYNKARESGRGEIIRLHDNENIHRILRGPVRVRTAFWPTEIEDEATGQKKITTKAIIVPQSEETIFDKLAIVELKIRSSLGQKNPRSGLKPSDRWFYLVFDREAEPDEEGLPKIQASAYPWSVYDELGSLESEVSTLDKSKLRHGLIWMFDAMITKTVDPNLDRMHGTKYKTVAAEGNKVAGEIPITWLTKDWDEVSKEIESSDAWSYFFTPEELKALDKCELDLDTMFKPNSETDIATRLKENPIALGAKTLPDMRLMAKELEKLEVSFLTGEATKMPEVETKTTPLSLGSGEVEAETVVEDVPKAEVVEVVEETTSDDQTGGLKLGGKKKPVKWA